MPVILDDDDLETWMAGDPKRAAKLMKPFPPEKMTMFPVSTFVNYARNQGGQCIDAAEVA
jgi:putative SOS response-associated peptidase YedK